jgi:hypothetical protein
VNSGCAKTLFRSNRHNSPSANFRSLVVRLLSCNGLGHAQPLVQGGIAHVRLPIYAAPPTADNQSTACFPPLTPLHIFPFSSNICMLSHRNIAHPTIYPQLIIPRTLYRSSQSFAMASAVTFPSKTDADALCLLNLSPSLDHAWNTRRTIPLLSFDSSSSRGNSCNTETQLERRKLRSDTAMARRADEHVIKDNNELEHLRLRIVGYVNHFLYSEIQINLNLTASSKRTVLLGLIHIPCSLMSSPRNLLSITKLWEQVL